MNPFPASENVKLFYTGAINSKAQLQSTHCYGLQFHKNRLVGFIYGIIICYA